MGQTYVLQRDGKFYESLMSFYNETKALDFTIGSPRWSSENARRCCWESAVSQRGRRVVLAVMQPALLVG